MWSAAYSTFVHILLSPVATKGLWWAYPPKQSSKPPNWNMKHCKSVDFFVTFYNAKSPPQKRKAPLLKLSSSGSESAA